MSPQHSVEKPFQSCNAPTKTSESLTPFPILEKQNFSLQK